MEENVSYKALISSHTDPENEMTFSVLHIKNNRPLIEPTVDHSGSHVKWNVTSLSPVGPIIQTSQSVERHGVVLVYKQLSSDNINYNFHVYLATNSSSDIKVSVFGYDKGPDRPRQVCQPVSLLCFLFPAPA